MIETADEFVRLRTSDDPEEYNRASHDSALLPVWLEVIERFPEMRQWVAHNKTIPKEVYSALSKDEDENVRVILAMKRKCPVPVLQVLSEDRNESVRNAVARNKKTPSEILAKLAHDEWDVCAKSAFCNLAERGIQVEDK
jgi:hypothetical protein